MCAMELYAVYPVLIGQAAFVVGLVALFFIVKAAILSALAEDRRRQQPAVANTHTASD